jgi:hypothetical protein
VAVISAAVASEAPKAGAVHPLQVKIIVIAYTSEGEGVYSNRGCERSGSCKKT